MSLPTCLKSSGAVTLVLAILVFAGSVCFLPPVAKFEDASDNLISDSLELASSDKAPDAFMVRKDERISKDPKPYYSQFGLTYHVLLPFRSKLNYQILPFILSLSYSALSAFTFWRFSRYLCSSRGETEGFSFLILCCMTPTFLLFSGSYYWQLPLLAAPFLVTYALGVSRPGLAISLSGLCLFFRFLGGYEYTSTLILSPIAAVLLRLAYEEVSLRIAILRSVALGAAGLAAFLLAIGLHLWFLRLSEGTWEAAYRSFTEVALYRTSGDYFGRPTSLRNDFICLVSSFFRNESVLIVGLGLLSCVTTFFSDGLDKTIRIGIALLFALLAGLSWQLLARGHMRDHAHINFIVYCIPFALCCYIAFCRIINPQSISTALHIKRDGRN